MNTNNQQQRDWNIPQRDGYPPQDNLLGNIINKFAAQAQENITTTHK